jgi:hypothetical protein
VTIVLAPNDRTKRRQNEIREAGVPKETLTASATFMISYFTKFPATGVLQAFFLDSYLFQKRLTK